ncbi:hypothetical protein R70006_04994 [Paraburkholderia domus]|nr:hypothetical protein R70006_04994 [Paraburkholderia domus]
MNDHGTQSTPQRRLVQASTWGNPRNNSTPRFNRLMLGWARRCNRVLVPIAFAGFLAIIALIVFLTFGTRFSHLYASDGTIFSCEIPLVNGTR